MLIWTHLFSTVSVRQFLLSGVFYCGPPWPGALFSQLDSSSPRCPLSSTVLPLRPSAALLVVSYLRLFNASLPVTC